jgi:CRP/FNR family transcriptional regulator
MTAQPVQLDAIRNACQACTIHDLCLPRGMERAEVEQLEGIVGQSGPIAAKAHLFRAGEPCNALFAVKSGLVKASTLSREGDEQVNGFYMGGDLLGFDGLADDVHSCSAQALDTTSVCVIPMDQLDRVATAVSGLHRQLRRLMARSLSYEERVMRSLRDLSSESRLIAFLLRLSERHQERRLDGHCFALKIPSRDLASYLDLRPETVSRNLTRLQEEGLIHLQRKGRILRLLHPERLRDRVPGYAEEFQTRPWGGPAD